MKTLVWTGPRSLEVMDTSEPMTQPGEVLLRVLKVGICGSELSGYLGENSLRVPPLIMGHEFSGEIVAIDSAVQGWQLGQRVTVNPLLTCGRCQFCRNGHRQLCPNKSIIGIHRPGAFAEFVSVPVSACHCIEDETIGALVEPLACSVRATMQANVRLGDIVLVMGAGIIGLMALRLAEEMGASRRIIVDTNPTRLDKAEQWGATDQINPLDTDAISTIHSIFPGGIDRAIDAVGLPITRQQALSVVRPGGRVVFIGLHHDQTSLPGNRIVRSEVEIVGSFCYTDADFSTAIHLLTNKRIVPDPSWLDIRPLQTGKQSFDEQIDGPATYPKIMLNTS